jgi:hypothetical protein
MNNRPSKCGAWLAPAFAALAFVATVPAASRVSPASGALRCLENAANENLAAPLSPLASARRDCPLFGAIIEEYALQDLGVAFDSMEQAQAWYDSPSYRAIRPIRHQSAKSRVYIVEGAPRLDRHEVDYRHTAQDYRSR